MPIRPRPLKPRDYISPSDLTFLYSECPKCLWLKYNEGISRPGFMPLVGPMASFQESLYRGLPTSLVSPKLPLGTVSSWGGSVESTPIEVDGIKTKWRIKGKYDLILTFDNGTIGLVDCKITTAAMTPDKVNFYAPQLEAYCFALENPLTGQSSVVSQTGLLMWKIIGANGELESGYSFPVEHDYLSSVRDKNGFQELMKNVITTLEGPIPESGGTCSLCSFVSKRNSLRY